jgi:hypothetical protein
MVLPRCAGRCQLSVLAIKAADQITLQERRVMASGRLNNYARLLPFIDASWKRTLRRRASSAPNARCDAPCQSTLQKEELLGFADTERPFEPLAPERKECADVAQLDHDDSQRTSRLTRARRAAHLGLDGDEAALMDAPFELAGDFRSCREFRSNS